MKVLVTGSNGFIGKNLISHLQEISDVEIITYDINDDFNKIEKNIDSVDFIFHLAGINRPKNTEEYYKGNTDLTIKIVNLLKDKKIPILITSSIQAEKNNDYGKSKKNAEEYVQKNLDKYYIYRLHNVFGKWCKPNYNSVVATFCYNISHDLDIKIDNPENEITMVYIDDVVEEFINVMKGNTPDEIINDYCFINPRYNITIKYLCDRLYEFKHSMNTLYIPNTGNDLIKKLYSTYISYADVKNMVTVAKKNTDERGSFIELIRTKECGQFSVSFSKPGVIRGNHYHHTKMERFIVIKGKAKISFSSVINDDSYTFIVDDSEINIITIPVGYTHNIENIGDDEMILAIWCNELFDKTKPDTYYRMVKEN